jgi:hypothetical protein
MDLKTWISARFFNPLDPMVLRLGLVQSQLTYCNDCTLHQWQPRVM